MPNGFLGLVAAGCLLLATAISADDQETSLSAEFLHYLAEFSDEQGEIQDPEILVEMMNHQQITTEQESLSANTSSGALAEEVNP